MSPSWLALSKAQDARQSWLPVIHRNPEDGYSHSTNLAPCFSHCSLYNWWRKSRSSRRQIQADPKCIIVLWIVLWENLPLWTTDKAEGVLLVCLGTVTSNITVIPKILSKFCPFRSAFILLFNHWHCPMKSTHQSALLHTLPSFTLWSPQTGMITQWHQTRLVIRSSGWHQQVTCRAVEQIWPWSAKRLTLPPLGPGWSHPGFRTAGTSLSLAQRHCSGSYSLGRQPGIRKAEELWQIN